MDGKSRSSLSESVSESEHDEVERLLSATECLSIDCSDKHLSSVGEGSGESISSGIGEVGGEGGREDAGDSSDAELDSVAGTDAIASTSIDFRVAGVVSTLVSFCTFFGLVSGGVDLI